MALLVSVIACCNSLSFSFAFVKSAQDLPGFFFGGLGRFYGRIQLFFGFTAQTISFSFGLADEIGYLRMEPFQMLFSFIYRFVCSAFNILAGLFAAFRGKLSIPAT